VVMLKLVVTLNTFHVPFKKKLYPVTFRDATETLSSLAV